MTETQNVISVTALNRYVRSLLDGNEMLVSLRLRGEISNFVHHRSGHFYFSLKDEACSVKAVMFRTDAVQLNYEPQNGMCVIAECRVSLFERDGSFQVYVRSMFPDGLGSIRMAFEQLKDRLAKAGLFDPAHKKTIPPLPAVIGVVTSGTGAALQDIRNVLSRRYPLARLVVSPVNVQGAEAAGEIAAAIAEMDASGLADVMIVARGGGSAEDLWVFNDERIARAAYNCHTPIISAIGHEIDFTILDFAADLRAPTPSAAAELAAPDIQTLFSQNEYYKEKIQQCLVNKCQTWYNEVAAVKSRLELSGVQKAVPGREAGLGELRTALEKQISALMCTRKERLGRDARLAESLNPCAVLARGYAILHSEDGSAAQNKPWRVGSRITVETAEQLLKCTVDAIDRKDRKA